MKLPITYTAGEFPVAMKAKLFTVELGFGRAAWVERTSYAAIVAKADFHPDDPIVTLYVGTARECYHAVMSVYRSMRNNRRGRIAFGNYAPLDWPVTNRGTMAI